jgi:hypothetical protein
MLSKLLSGGSGQSLLKSLDVCRDMNRLGILELL